MQEEKMTTEYFKPSDWMNFFVGSEGTIINNTGCVLIKNFIDGTMYVGIEAHGKRYLRKLATLVMETHNRCGRKIPDELTVAFLDGNPRNCKMINLHLVQKHGSFEWNEYRPTKFFVPSIKKTAIRVV